MNSIEVSGRVLNKYKQIARCVAERVLIEMNQPDCLEVAIEFVSEKEIQRLNNELRGIDRVTDVLSFPSTNLKVGELFDLNDAEMKYLMLDENLYHFGDMAICFKQTERQAKEFGVAVEQEIKKLVIHSMLHLMGYDHIDDGDFEIMKKKEEELDSLIKIWGGKNGF